MAKRQRAETLQYARGRGYYLTEPHPIWPTPTPDRDWTFNQLAKLLGWPEPTIYSHFRGQPGAYVTTPLRSHTTYGNVWRVPDWALRRWLLES